MRLRAGGSRPNGLKSTTVPSINLQTCNNALSITSFGGQRIFDLLPEDINRTSRTFKDRWRCESSMGNFFESTFRLADARYE